MIERIKQLVNQKGITLAKMESSLGFGNGTIGKWRTQDPSATKLLKVADFLNTTTDYLLTGRKAKTTLTKNEKKIIDILNSLHNNEEQIMLIGAADNYARLLSSYRSSNANDSCYEKTIGYVAADSGNIIEPKAVSEIELIDVDNMIDSE